MTAYIKEMANETLESCLVVLTGKFISSLALRHTTVKFMYAENASIMDVTTSRYLDFVSLIDSLCWSSWIS